MDQESKGIILTMFLLDRESGPAPVVDRTVDVHGKGTAKAFGFNRNSLQSKRFGRSHLCSQSCW